MPIEPFTKSHTENNAEQCPFSLNLVFSTHTRGEMVFSLSPVLAIRSQMRRNQNETQTTRVTSSPPNTVTHPDSSFTDGHRRKGPGL